MDLKQYINQFHVLGIDDEINCDYLSNLLYTTILNRFRTTISENEYYYFREYQERVFDLIENLRELDVDIIQNVFEFINSESQYLADNIILQWSLPRTDNYLSKNIYKIKYKENIKKYQHKLNNMIQHPIIKNFCIETLTRTNSVPIHCIDLLWYYMDTLSLEFSFCNSESSQYINIIMPEHSENHNVSLDIQDEYIELCLDMEFILEMGLGQISLDYKGSLKSFLKNFVTNLDLIKKLLTIKTKKNYLRQLTNINNNLKKFFDEDIIPIPEEIIKELSKLIR